MARVGWSVWRIWHIALNTLREASRQKLGWCLVLLAVLAVLGARAFRDFHFGSPELKFIADLGGGALAVFGPVLAVVATAQLFFGEIERRTVLTLLAKPVGRTEFILGKFLGLAAMAGAFCAVLTLVLGSVLWARESSLRAACPEAFPVGHVVNYRHLAFTGLFQWFKLLVLAAFTLLVASYARTQLFATVTGFVVWVICELQHLALAAGSHAAMTGVLVRIFPNFQLFTLDDAPVTWARVGWVALYTAGYGTTACMLAAFSFRRREI